MKKGMTSIILVLSACSFMFIAGTRNSSLVKLRKQYNLNATDPLENAPPAMAFTTIVMGGFRGLIADILWIRISLLQEKGQYFEMVQLSDWVTKLDPRNNEIWDFHSWNMTYNISVMMPDYEDRWRWVSNGMRLLRDEGILYNRGDPEVYQQLGWIFQDKIAKPMDLAHKVYQQRWAEEMTALLGGPTPDYKNFTEAQLARIKDDYKLDIAVMQELDELHGPLDWTKPEPHALHWAYLGVLRSNRGKTTSCERMIRQTAKAIREGGYNKSMSKQKENPE